MLKERDKTGSINDKSELTLLIDNSGWKPKLKSNSQT